MSHAGQSIKQSNVAAGTYKFTLDGGIYAFSYVGTGTGTVDVSILLPDGSTYKTGVFTQITATTGYQTGVYCPPGQYQVVISTFTANYFAITRVPAE